MRRCRTRHCLSSFAFGDTCPKRRGHRGTARAAILALREGPWPTRRSDLALPSRAKVAGNVGNIGAEKS
ncbi:hypothetical protein Salmuc_04386 [Salipiger mucosus DSM 16094]|uniref:Uncharacterized protein n=1 Tax=Salipiger mucosus DSM 16094 TaxID=1123237 RepID=S9RXT8_9RHOB|nr:hypothetical protein Salmuc_04386 [Salipiger mucosus DSM 16094]